MVFSYTFSFIPVTIEIKANDGAAGTIGFAMPPGPVNLVEPNERQGGVSNMTIYVERRPGHFGISSVKLDVIPLTDYPAIGNILISNDSLVFLDGQSRVSFWIAVADDDIPEEEQSYKLVLSEPSGGSRLDGNSFELMINISTSDYPRGLVNLCVREMDQDNCENEIFVDELTGQQHLPIEITREYGTSGNISVDLITVGKGASITRNPSEVLLSPIQLMYGSETVRWFSFRMYDFTYFLMLSSSTAGPLATFEGMGHNASESSFTHQKVVDHAPQSTWFRWQGSLVAVQPVATDNAVSATSFEEDGIHYIVIANFGVPSRLRSKTRVYRVQPDGTLIFVSLLFFLTF